MPERLSDFLAKQPPDVPSIIGRDVLPVQSLCVIGAPSKANKSFIALNLGVSIAAGKPVFNACYEGGNVPILPIKRPWRVLLLEQELGFVTLQKRLRKMITAYDLDPDPVGLDIYIESKDTQMQLNTTEGRRLIESHISSCRPDVVILDPLCEFHGLEENNNQHMSFLIKVLKGWIEKYKCSFIIVHHEGHSSGQFPRQGGDRLRGASALYGAVDSLIMITPKSAKHEKQPTLLLEFEVRHGEPIEPLWVRRMESGICEFLGMGAQQPVKAEPQMPEILVPVPTGTIKTNIRGMA